MEKINSTVEVTTESKSGNNPYANGKGRAIIERLFRESKERREKILKEYQENADAEKLYAEMNQKQTETDAKR